MGHKKINKLGGYWSYVFRIRKEMFQCLSIHAWYNNNLIILNGIFTFGIANALLCYGT